MPRVTCALGPDAAGTLLWARLAAVRSHLDAAMYEVSPAYAFGFAAAAERGASVRLLLDAHGGANSGTAARLAGHQGICRVIPRSAGTDAHWKLLVLDGAVATASGNLIHRDAPRDLHGQLPPRGDAGAGTREWWVIVDGSPRLAAAATAAIDSRWRDAVAPPPGWESMPEPEPELEPEPETPAVGDPRPLVPPLDLDVDDGALRLLLGGAKVASALEALLGSARARLLVTVPYVHRRAPAVERLLGRLGEARRRGADARLLLGAVPPTTAMADLRGLPFPVRVMDPLRCTTGHAKGLVADDVVVVTSANWSLRGLGGGLESGLAIEAPAAANYYAAAFEHDWATATEVGR